MLNRNEYLILSKELQKFHEVFDRFWKITNIIEDNSIETACTVFDPDDFKNTLAIKINSIFWNNLTLYQQVFLICHEYLHIILFHGFRIYNLKNLDIEKANIAADLVVHIFILEKFGMDKNKIDPENAFYWAENVFPAENTNNTFEYFYNKLLKNNDTKNGNSYKLVDSHEGFQSIKSIDQITKFINDNLSEEGKESLKNMMQQKAGTESLGNLIDIKPKEVKKIEFEKLIKKWLNMRLKMNEKEDDIWTRENRRIRNLSADLILPAEYDYIYYAKTKEKLDVYIFLDASGSCSSYINDFYALTKVINLDFFTPHFFTFDNVVFDVDIKNSKLYGGGGTSFKNIEKFLLKLEKYPDSVFILTDGYGDFVYPKHPDRWLWFLTDSYFPFIPKGSNSYNIKSNIKFKN